MATTGGENLRADREGKMEKETLDEKLPGLFEPDTLLPIQYFEAMRRKHLLEGEKRLILSVLEDAVECFMKCIESATNKGQRLFRDADEWINLEDKRWVFSFDNVCEMLDINADYMRAGLRRWKERKLVAIAQRNEERAQQQALAEAQALLNPADSAMPIAATPVLEVKHVAKPVAAKPATAKPAPMINARRKSEPARVASRSHSKLRKARA
jgi:hypothetical protein